MKIAIDARMYGPEQFSGIGNYIKNLTDNIFEIDQINQYIIFLREPEFSKFLVPNSRVKKVLVKSKWYSFAEQFILPFEFSREKFDLIHYPHFNSPIFYFKKSICTIHDTTPLTFPGHKMKSIFRRLAYRLVFWATVKKAKKIITVSDSTQQALAKVFPSVKNKIQTIHIGVDEHFRSIQDCGIINDVKTRFGISKPYLFFVGVWRSHKNVEGLIKAFNLLKEKYNIPHQLVLGGREDLHYTEVSQVIENSKFKNDIIKTGFISEIDLPVLYSSADCFVLPSFMEGFGLIAIEAQSCGCVVVSSQTTSMPEILNDSAIFFDPNKIEDMAEKIYNVINSEELKNNLKQKGFVNIVRFNWRKCAEQTLKLYKDYATNQKNKNK